MEESKREDLSVQKERAFLAGVILPDSDPDYPNPLSELAALTRAANAEVVGGLIQKRDRIVPASHIGKGKAEQLAIEARALDADVIIFDNDLSPAQIRVLEEITECKVIDRSELILDIFASRAQTHQARLQVELAQLEYTAPRLRGMWTHLERIAGAGGGTTAGAVGGVGTRGPGERQIEIDRRLVQKRVSALKAELAKIDQRKLREVQSRSDAFTVSLVGYTNAGKSSLTNVLTGSDVKVKDELFATLDTRTRQWHLGEGITGLLSDTVGFVRHLPHHLVASFRATLEEAMHADLLLHVADASNANAHKQIAAVNEVLDELGCGDKPCLLLLNKIDAIDDPTLLQALQAAHPDSIAVSAKTGRGLDTLVEQVVSRVRLKQVHAELIADAGDGAGLSFIHRTATLLEQRYEDGRAHFKVTISPADLGRLAEACPNVEIMTQAPPA